MPSGIGYANLKRVRRDCHNGLTAGKGEDAEKSSLNGMIEQARKKTDDASSRHRILKLELGKPNRTMTVELDKPNHKMSVELGKPNHKMKQVPGKMRQKTTLEPGKPKHKVPAGKRVLVHKPELAVGKQVPEEHSKQGPELK